MEALQQDEDATAKSRAHGEFDMENDGHEFEAQRAGAGPVRVESYQRLRTRYEALIDTVCDSLNQQNSSAPSGIAKLRKSLDLSNTSSNNNEPEPMNIDDLIFPSSTASPAGVSPSPPTEGTSVASNTTASAIPIKTRKDVQDQSHANFPPSAPPQDRRNLEFDYVQRRVRKTSIDETRVRLNPGIRGWG